MVDPYEPLEPLDSRTFKKEILTLQQARVIIEKQIKYVMNLPPQTWGFTRDDIIENLQEVLEDLEEMCQNN